ncbi:binding-protein-dependent transport systems inner membrane component [Haloterrigena turkmenica DSM 5511]|uniref:Binding-protein-dependent transport systems inner membrane component n=1 Tax=Haloterrigena turkmenica (strain ATCC 51198 / DSM 5511 / JCM 9101 / NCIMB 13204 / VKM B-1734 / 4k) TaxID=543526 RepID=D2RUN9_HALTV|nr:sugar ABC transporter permease [Haloterrigena turkmenica]ADB61211.1 binding-protein-dependent transport systems inner membrane component [Haloterrigena turkmenica DSM 5511]
MASETGESIRPRGAYIPWDHLPVERETVAGVATVLPVVVLYVLIAVFPIAFAFWASLHNIHTLNPEWKWVGLENYREVMNIATFWGSLWRGIVYMVGSTLIQLVVGLWMALVLNRITRGQKLLTAVVFTAYLIPTIIVSLVALRVFDPPGGVFQMMGAEWFNLWSSQTAPLGSRGWAMRLLILIGSWKFAVFVTIFTLAQLRAIPDRFYEAAKICGANRWQMFRDITLPRLMGIVLVVVLLRSIFMFNKFDIIWQLTQGGPGNATTTLPVLAYKTVYTDQAYGLANAIAVVMFLFLLASAVVYFKIFNPSEEVETTT